MTAVNWILQPDQIMVLTDTLSWNARHGPLCYFGKVWSLLHLRGLMFTTGDGGLSGAWAVELNRCVGRDLDDVEAWAPDVIAELYEALPTRSARTSTVHHVGWSHRRGEFFCTAYRSTHGFEPHRLAPGVYSTPGFDDDGDIPTDKPVEFLLEVMKRQRLVDLDRPRHDRVGIGGEAILYHLTTSGLFTTVIHRFDDYDATYARMVMGLTRR